MNEPFKKTKLLYTRNEETNMGMCVCLLDEAPKEAPKEDVISLCMGKCDKEGIPENQIVMTPAEASYLGEALIGSRWLHEFKHAFLKTIVEPKK